MEIQQLLSFTLASFLMALMPGPDNVYVMTESLHKGKLAGVWLAFGLNSGIIVHTALAVTGVSLLIQQSPLAFTVIEYLGIFYLLYILYKTVVDQSGFSKSESNQKASYSALGQYKTGVLMNVLNPKVSMFFLAFLPQFVNQDAQFSLEVQMIILGAIFMISGFMTFASIALLADLFRSFFESPKFFQITKWLKVAVLALIVLFIVIN